VFDPRPLSHSRPTYRAGRATRAPIDKHNKGRRIVCSLSERAGEPTNELVASDEADGRANKGGRLGLRRKNHQVHRHHRPAASGYKNTTTSPQVQAATAAALSQGGGWRDTMCKPALGRLKFEPIGTRRRRRARRRARRRPPPPRRLSPVSAFKWRRRRRAARHRKCVANLLQPSNSGQFIRAKHSRRRPLQASGDRRPASTPLVAAAASRASQLDHLGQRPGSHVIRRTFNQSNCAARPAAARGRRRPADAEWKVLAFAGPRRCALVSIWPNRARQATVRAGPFWPFVGGMAGGQCCCCCRRRLWLGDLLLRGDKTTIENTHTAAAAALTIDFQSSCQCSWISLEARGWKSAPNGGGPAAGPLVAILGMAPRFVVPVSLRARAIVKRRPFFVMAERFSHSFESIARLIRDGGGDDDDAAQWINSTEWHCERAAKNGRRRQFMSARPGGRHSRHARPDPAR
jgi:hypothetical protein